MMKAGICVRAGWLDEDDMGYFTVVATNGTHTTSVEIFDHIASFQEFGQALAEFPHPDKAIAAFKGGTFSLDMQRGTWLIMRGYSYDAGGRSALEIDANHSQNQLADFRSWFSIRAEIASLNKLGQLLQHWQPAQQPSISWEAYAE